MYMCCYLDPKSKVKKGVHLPGTTQMPLKRRATGAPQLLVT
uniref:Uncharacterized protein n=2 Tax=Triticum urartu TaxID=4572 RepID=A0A8R7UDT1_TRIUA